MIYIKQQMFNSLKIKSSCCKADITVVLGIPCFQLVCSDCKLVLIDLTREITLFLDDSTEDQRFEFQASDFNDHEIISTIKDDDYPETSDREYTKNYSKLKEKLKRITKDKGGEKTVK